MMYKNTIHLRGIYGISITRATGNRAAQNTVLLDGNKLDLDRSLAIRNHSPAGFDWGYLGSGPAQLALAICLELYPQRLAEQVYQRFKAQFIATLETDKDFAQHIDLTEFNASLPIYRDFKIKLYIQNEVTKVKRQKVVSVCAESAEVALYVADTDFYNAANKDENEFVYRSEEINK